MLPVQAVGAQHRGAAGRVRHQDRVERRRIEKAVGKLGRETDIQRNGKVFAFLTNEERDVEALAVRVRVAALQERRGRAGRPRVRKSAHRRGLKAYAAHIIV